MAESILIGAAPAKINLSLEVLARRDDGYHEIDTILQTLVLGDRVVVVVDGNHEGVVVTGTYQDSTPANRANLAFRAAELLARRVGRTNDRLLVRLDKLIPPAGGLGGGASDAATVLRLLGKHWEAPESLLLQVANEVGSDEAALVLGGTVRARGRGDRVEPIPSLPAHDVVLFIPPDTIEQKTPRMFAALAGLPFDTGKVTELAALRQRVDSVDIYNTFERVAFDLFPGLAEQWEWLERATGAAIRLAGAGPTLFWIGSPGEGEEIARRASGSACTIIPTRTADSLWRR